MSLSHRCGGILAHSSLQNCFNSATLEGFRAWMDCLRSYHSISIGFKPRLWLDHSKTLILFFLSHSEVDLLVCMGSLSCCITQVRLSLRSQTNSRIFSFRIFWYSAEFMVPSIMASRPGPEAAKQPQTITLPPPCLTVGMMFFLWNVVLVLHQMQQDTPSKKFNFCRISPQNICPKFLGIIKIFLANVRQDFCVLFGQQWLLPWNSPVDAVFAQSLSYCWIMNTDLNWGKWGLQFFRCCSGFFYNLLDESSLRSWSNFGRPVTLVGQVHHCYKFSPFVDNGSDCGSLESQRLRNGFITLSRLICQLFCFSSDLEFL